MSTTNQQPEGAASAITASSSSATAAADLPFLVTHWLSNYNAPSSSSDSTNAPAAPAAGGPTAEQRAAAMEQIRQASSQLATAFASLGEFGTTVRPGLQTGSILQAPEPEPAQFADIKRNWDATVAGDHLNLLVESALSTAAAQTQTAAPNLLGQAHEQLLEQRRHPTAGGRTLQDAIHLDDNEDDNDDKKPAAAPRSMLQRPTLLPSSGVAADSTCNNKKQNNNNLASVHESTRRHAADCMRAFLTLRDQVRRQQAQLQGMDRSTAHHQHQLETLDAQRASLLTTEIPQATRLERLDDIKERHASATRVVAQLQRQRTTLVAQNTADCARLAALRHEAHAAYRRQQHVCGKFAPAVSMGSISNAGSARCSVLRHVLARQVGRGCGTAGAGLRAAVATRRQQEQRQRLVQRQLVLRPQSLREAAVTINTHLSYPVYCLQFDKSGRYFVSGADDYLVRVFCLRPHTKLAQKQQQPAQHHSQPFTAGAVLVCTLRGHAGVINNIDVSADNALLATASEDGDVRIWGLRDGSPVAILRGHEGGANTVVFSASSPNRVVTAGGDGLARCWDIRGACLKRYGAVVGQRPEYQQPARLLQKQTRSTPADRRRSSLNAGAQEQQQQEPNGSTNQPAVALPPLPVREPAAAAGDGDNSNAATASATGNNAADDAAGSNNDNNAEAAVGAGGENGNNDSAAGSGNNNNANAAPAVPLPPLPPPANAAAAAAAGANAALAADEPIDAVAGRFVANDAVDEGVKLLTKLQHGTPRDPQQQQGAGTRSRRAPVKVLCVAKCPHGGHFATGSEDGICRIWRDDADPVVDRIDRHFAKNCDFDSDTTASQQRQQQQLLLTLRGHLSAITDLEYSRAGDRILSASQKDGVVRIWSWNIDPSSQTVGIRSKPSHILIKLSNPGDERKKAAAAANGGQQRRRPNRGGTSSRISCDVAAWVCDDSKIVTSQCELEKLSGSEILPGSQYIFLWDSCTGDCLLGISNGHTRQCPVVISHPTDPSIVCSAGADGQVKLWDWSAGKCISSHLNTLEFGPIDPRERGKPAGYLDGDWSPDGMNLVLTDDSGRITVFDLQHGEHTADGTENRASLTATTTWMSEQYFSNDYYELFYDQNGYCVERGSELPPHMAPRGVRCTNSGTPWSPAVSEAFRGLLGPTPIAEDVARWSRLRARWLSTRARDRLLPNRGNLIGQYDSQTTILFGDAGPIASTTATGSADAASAPAASQPRRSTNREGTSHMSSNYRWGDYDDIPDNDAEEDIEMDPDDEEFEINEGGRGRTLQESSESEDETMFEPASPEAPTRTSSRQRRRARHNNDDSSDSESDRELVEYMSTNNEPSGPFAADYESHFFRLTDARSRNVERDWVRRLESNSSYGGRRNYTPQVGDSVVYIPRAHYETVQKYPSLDAPWQSWPEGAEWPVVRCTIRNIRFRFPFKAYSGGANRLNSIVAILTLEITGIPELSSDSRFDWPKPTFIAPTRTHFFELSLFDNGEADFIVPTGLYICRLKQLEDVLSRSSISEDEAEINVYYEESGAADSELVPYSGRIDGIGDYVDPLDGVPHLSASGYKVVAVIWDNGDPDLVSPWEVSFRDSPADPERSHLSEEEKKKVREALKVVREMESVENFFLEPVNTSMYTDYASRVEVAMDLSFVAKRLEADYYCNEYSVVADVKLIKDNCIKYNGQHDAISHTAQSMLEKFEEELLDPAALEDYRKFQQELTSKARSSSGEASSAPTEASPVPTNTTRRTVRRSSHPQNRSSLETLPSPATVARQSRSTRQRRRAGTNNQNERRGERRETRGARSILEAPPAAAGSRRTLADLAGSSRGRRTSNRGGLRSSVAQPSSGRATRSTRSQGLAADMGGSGQVLGRGPPAIPQLQDGPARPLRSTNRYSSIQQGRRESARGASRSSTRNSISYADQPSDIDMDEESEPEVVQNGTRSRARGLRIRISGRSGGNENHESPQATSSRATRAAARSSRAAPSAGNADPFSSSAAGRSRRASARAATRQQSPPHEEDNSSSEEEEPATRRSGRRTSQRRGARRQPSSDEESHHEEEETSDSDASEVEEMEEDESSLESPGAEAVHATRRSSRRKAPPKRSSPSGYSSPEEDVGNGRKRNRSQTQNSPRQSPRTKRGAVKSYEDPSSSEFGSDVDESPPARARGSRQAKKKKGRSPAKKKAKRNSGVSVWPEIAPKHITKITKNILNRLRSIDEGDLFAEPVIETYPDMADQYLAVVEEPMDFRTIEEERLNYYRSITELQRDLILVMNNCLAFNTDDNEFSQLARTILDMLTDIFMEACDECNVDV